MESTKDIKTTEEARNIVRRAATDLSAVFTSGEIQAEGIKHKYINFAKLGFANLQLKCYCCFYRIR